MSEEPRVDKGDDRGKTLVVIVVAVKTVLLTNMVKRLMIVTMTISKPKTTMMVIVK